MNTTTSFLRIKRIKTILASTGMIAALACAGHAQAAAVKLSPYNADPAMSTVSGISSGGYMAVQMHIAYSASFMTGAAIFAGGPFYCTKGSVSTATGSCMTGSPAPSAAESINTTNSYASAGYIDATSNLSNSKVYLFGGTNDSTVKQSVMNVLKTYYANYVPAANITYDNTTAAEHAWISPYGPNACGTKADPYISNCSKDPQQTFLSMFYGTLSAKNTGTLGGSFIEFDQKEFFDDKNPKAHSVADSGWMYVPGSCAANKSCKVHISYHGCQQYYAKIGDKFIKKAGLNEWADTNNIIVVYPQTVTGTGNPNGCWDWWAYDDQNFAKKTGRQMLMSKRILDRITSGFIANSSNPAPTGLTKGTVTYSTVPLSWTASSGATGYNVYRSDSTGGARTRVNAAALSSSTVSYTVGGLEPNTTYYFVVKATDSGGLETADSNQISATTPDAPLGSVAAPTLSAGTPTHNSVPLSWAAVTGSTGSNIYMSTSSTGSRTKVNANPVTATSYTVGGLNASTAYTFWARSLDASALAGSESAAVSVTTANPPFCKLWTSSNYAHVQAGRATQNAASHAIAVGSGTDMGLNNTYTNTTLKEAPAGYYVVSSDCNGVVAIPTGLTVGTVTNNSVALSWTGVSGASGYNAYHATTPIGTLTRANSALITGTGHTVTGLQSATTYYFQVRAQDAAGTESQLSDQKSATTTSNAVAAPTGLTVGAVNSSSVGLSWTASSGAAGYNIYWSDITDGVLTKANGAAVTGTSYTVGQLKASTLYFFKVKAYDSTNQESVASNEVSATTAVPSLVAAPTGLMIASGATDTSIPVSFSASTSADLQGYNLYFGTASGAYSKHNATPIGTTSYTYAGLNSSTTYYLTARAINLTNQESGNSNEVSGSTLTGKPAQPNNVAVAAGTTDTAVPLTWSASAGPNLSGYNVYAARQAGGPYTRHNTSLVAGTSYSVNKLLPATDYYFIVRAQNASGTESVDSHEVAAKTLPATYCKVWYSNNYTHVAANPKRATTDGSYAYAVGSGTKMGLYSTGVYSYLREKPQGYYTYSSTAITCP